MSGRMNIFNTRIRSSPGKLTRVMDCGEGLASRPRNPRIRPTSTPAIVKTKSVFSPNQSTTYVHVQIRCEWDIKKEKKCRKKGNIWVQLTSCNLSSGVFLSGQALSSSTVVIFSISSEHDLEIALGKKKSNRKEVLRSSQILRLFNFRSAPENSDGSRYTFPKRHRDRFDNASL